MKAYDPAQSLISLHIPKTGGVSLREILGAWFGDKLAFHYIQGEQLPLRRTLQPGGCIHGHFNALRGFGVDEYYPDAPQFITFLRDPFERFVSHWFYINKRKAKGERVWSPDDAPDFQTFFENKRRDYEAGELRQSFVWHLPRAPATPSVFTDLSDRFVFVGITERFQPSLDALAAALGKPPMRAVQENISPRSEDLSAWRAPYERAFPIEFEIYEAASALNAELIRQAAS